jgi:hypothetical protein
MLAHLLADYIGITSPAVERLLRMRPSDIYQDPMYKKLVESLDREYIRSTLRDAHKAYKMGLPQFMEDLSSIHRFSDTPMSAYTLSNCLVAYLDAPEHMADFLDRHNHIPKDLMRDGLPHLIQMLSQMPQGCNEWQRAMAIISIPLVAPV